MQSCHSLVFRPLRGRKLWSFINAKHNLSFPPIKIVKTWLKRQFSVWISKYTSNKELYFNCTSLFRFQNLREIDNKPLYPTFQKSSHLLFILLSPFARARIVSNFLSNDEYEIWLVFKMFFNFKSQSNVVFVTIRHLTEIPVKQTTKKYFLFFRYFDQCRQIITVNLF